MGISFVALWMWLHTSLAEKLFLALNNCLTCKNHSKRLECPLQGLAVLLFVLKAYVRRRVTLFEEFFACRHTLQKILSFYLKIDHNRIPNHHLQSFHLIRYYNNRIEWWKALKFPRDISPFNVDPKMNVSESNHAPC
jgi:hypothetical protein